MKKIFLFFVVIIICFPLWSEKFESNSMGQKTGPARRESVYVLDVADNVEKLYNYTRLIFIKTTTQDKSKKTVNINWPMEMRSITEVYDNGLLVSSTKKNNGNEIVTNYHYKDKTLLFTSVYEKGELLEAEYYYRSAKDKSLVALKRYDKLSLLGNTFVYEDNVMYRDLGSGYTVKGDFEVSEDGFIHYDNNGIMETYDNNGLLIKQETDSSVVEYIYENGILTKKTTSETNTFTQSFYDGAKIIREEISKNGLITESTLFDSNGKIRTLYSKGQKLADVYYEADNRKINKIEYY